MRHIEQIEYKGCKINIHQDEGPENPFEAWDCEPPLLTYYGGRHGYVKAYQGAPETWRDIFDLIPTPCFERGKRVELVKEHLPFLSMRDFAEYVRDCGDVKYGAIEALCNHLGNLSGWRSATEWMDAACAILNWGGITAVCEQSNGYSQGDSTLCLAIATPAWVELVGAPPETHKPQMESAIQLYGWWAWGDVYGFTCEDENGEDLEDIGASVWGFYGPDHEKSGLLESAQNSIDCHLESQAKEAKSINAAFTF